MKALTEFILFYTSGESWPGHKQGVFWESADKFLNQRVDTVYILASVGILSTGNACRSKVTGWLAKTGKYTNSNLHLVN